MLHPADRLRRVDVEKLAEEAGISINYAVLPASSPHAYWDSTQRTITVRYGLPHRYTRSLIAHELGHAHYGHTKSAPKSERQADEYAAHILIDEDEYRQAESTYGTDTETLAFILNVSPGLIEVWRECLARRGNLSSRS